MQELILDDSLFPDLLSGKKRATVRRGVRSLTPGWVRFTGSGSNRTAYALVSEVRIKRLRNVTSGEADDDGGMTPVDLCFAMQRYYPDIQADDVVTVVLLEGRATTDPRGIE